MSGLGLGLGSLAQPNFVKSDFSGLLIYSWTLHGCTYMLTVHYIRRTNMSQINVRQQLFRATLRARLNSCLSLLLKWATLTTQTESTFQKIDRLCMGGAHS